MSDSGFRVTYNLGKVEGAAEEAIARALEIIGGMAEGYAKAAAPVDTGRLRNSITHEVEDKHTAVVGSNVEYAPYVELGTRKMKAKPYLRPAIENHIDEYKRVLERETGSRLK